jgi:putative ABC transport system permease protein
MSTSSIRAVTRVAWRGIGRSRGRSALIVVLVMLPVAAMAAVITLISTVSPTAEETATHSMGVAGYQVQMSDADMTTDTLRAALPAGATVEPWTYDLGGLVLPGRTVDVDARSMDLDGLSRGRLEITAGRQPQNQQEVAISASVAALAGVGVGESIELVTDGQLTVVGLVEDTFDIRGRLVLLDASVARESAQGERLGASPSWLVSVPDGVEMPYTADQCDFGTCPFTAFSRYRFSESPDDARLAVVVVGGFALVEAVLVAAAAFAVGVRRRQRELGLLAAAGAQRRHLAGTVLSEGLLLGGIAAVGGIALGVLAIVALSPWLDELVNRRAGPVEISAVFLTLAGSIGLLACFVAATVPARAAARLPVLLALSGRRPPLSPARRLLVLGVVMVGAAAVLTATGAAMRLSDPRGSLSMVFLLVGAICGVIGFGTCSPWLVERLEGLGLRLPVAARIALRDTARARSRNGPIVTAILAAFAATVAVSAYFASSDAEAAANWRPWLRADQLIIQGEAAATAGAQAAEALGAMAHAPVALLVGSDADDVYVVVEEPGPSSDDSEIAHTVTVGDVELLRALGAEGALSTLDGGGIVLVLPHQMTIVDDEVVPADPPTHLSEARIEVRDGVSGDEIDGLTVPGSVIATGLESGGMVPDAVMSSATADRLGLKAGPTSAYLIRMPRPVAEADVATAAGFAAQQPNTLAEASLGPIQPGQVFRWLLVLFSLLFALIVTGIAVALGETESRPDQRTLLAVGADPGIRRRIAAARAGVLGLMAGLLAVPAGLLPAWGLLGSRGAPLVVPIPEVIAAVAILPLAGILGALLLTRRIPDWSALRQAGS